MESSKSPDFVLQPLCLDFDDPDLLGWGRVRSGARQGQKRVPVADWALRQVQFRRRIEAGILPNVTPC